MKKWATAVLVLLVVVVVARAEDAERVIKYSGDSVADFKVEVSVKPAPDGKTARGIVEAWIVLTDKRGGFEDPAPAVDTRFQELASADMAIASYVLLADDGQVRVISGCRGSRSLDDVDRQGCRVVRAVAYADVVDFDGDLQCRLARKIQCRAGDYPEFGADDFEQRGICSGQAQVVAAQRIVADQDIGDLDAFGRVRIFADACGRMGEAHGRRIVCIGDGDR
jgi:hypothetical protein